MFHVLHLIPYIYLSKVSIHRIVKLMTRSQYLKDWVTLLLTMLKAWAIRTQDSFPKDHETTERMQHNKTICTTNCKSHNSAQRHWHCETAIKSSDTRLQIYWQSGPWKERCLSVLHRHLWETAGTEPVAFNCVSSQWVHYADNFYFFLDIFLSTQNLTVHLQYVLLPPSPSAPSEKWKRQQCATIILCFCLDR